jgi:EF-P beta-lysylation protein EpmB
MPNIITRNLSPVEQNWCLELANAISDPKLLLELLSLSPDSLEISLKARAAFTQRVPMSFIQRMKKGDPNDPLLRQVLPVEDELKKADGFCADPLQEQENAIPGLLHKYKNRVLMILKSGCAVNCRYCFRRHFPYEANKGNKAVWQEAIDYIKKDPDIDEVILSGGDPLMAKDHELAWLLAKLEPISHLKTLRIHSRLPVVIPSRVTDELLGLLSATRLKVVLITHINHANEIDKALKEAMAKLGQAKVTLLNQSVLLLGVNDSVEALKALSHALFSAGILPYYLHLLDKVEGAAHFAISDEKARLLVRGLLKEVSGYLVPKLMKEEAGKASKTPLNLHLE